MRNLVCLNRGNLVPSSVTAPDLPVNSAVFDAVNDTITVVLGPGEFGVIEVQQFQKNGSITTLASFPATSELVSFAHFEDSQQLVLILANGDIITASYDSPSGAACNPDDTLVEIVGSIDDGISAAAWSSDEETLVIVTSTNQVILLSRMFEPISEISMQEKDSLLSNHVDVGWGSEETQFKGKGAKALERELIKNLDLERDMNKKDPTMPTRNESGELTDFDSKEVEISWRSDCEFFAISKIDTINGTPRRIIRVYTREGELNNVSEPVDHLENHISWGNLITTVQRFPETPLAEQDLDSEEQGLNILFFERNGLRHGNFNSRLPLDTKIDQLLWNATNDVLAIWSNNKICLWTTKNYHWYLKQELIIEGISFIKWHPEKNLTLLVGTNHNIEIINLAYKTTTGPSYAPLDIGMNIVVDGTTVNFTPLSIANVPPPISYRDLDSSDNVLDVAVSRSNENFAILNNSSVEFANVDIDEMKKMGKHPKIVSRLQKSEFVGDGDTLRQVVFGQDDLVGVLLDNELGMSRILLIDVSNINDPFIKDSVDSNMKIILVKSQSNWDNISYQTIDGGVHIIKKSFNEELEDYEFIVKTIAKFPNYCYDYEVAVKPVSLENEYETRQDENNLVAFGITNNGKLFANETQLSTAITSLKVTENHLVITTAQHTLRFVHLNTETFKPLIESTDSTNDERIRSIERGSILVNVIPSKAAVVLQAPRGNLETINPRIMILLGVRKDIKSKNYKNAFITCRTHRIDLDILHDYDPELFMNNVELFVKQIDRVDYLDLFVSCLHEENVVETKYRETKSDEELDQKLLESQKQQQPEQQQYQKKKWIDPKDSKINKICEAILKVLLTDPYKKKFMQTIITAYGCEKPANLEAAVKLISGFDNQQDIEKSVVHLCFLQDVNVLYNVALGLYDIKLSLYIAQQSQKDPKEYLPFLQNLFDQTELRRKFLIDTHLKKYEKALGHLAEIIGEDELNDEFKDYVVEHELYKSALAIYRYNTEKQNPILELFAKNLYSKQEYEECAIIYEMLGNLEDAMESYILCSKWREALSISLRHGFKDQLEEVADRLISNLKEAHKYYDAARIEFNIMNNIENAVSLYCKEYYYEEAIYLSIKEGRNELVEEIVDPALGDGFGTIAELVADCKGQINSQLRRLRELRAKKEQDPYAFFGEMEDSEAADNVSIAASETSTKESFFTRYTGKTSGTAKTGASRRTAKNKRREERKRARGKKGTIYEEEYLVKSVGRLVERLQQTKAEAVRLIEGLLRRNKREQAYQIQKNFIDVLEELKLNIVEIYTISEKDRERIDENGEVYYIPEIPVPVIPEFEKKQSLDY